MPGIKANPATDLARLLEMSCLRRATREMLYATSPNGPRRGGREMDGSVEKRSTGPFQE